MLSQKEKIIQIKLNLEAKKIFIDEKYFNNNIAELNLNIAITYLKIKDYINAEKFAEECYTYSLSTKNKSLMSNIELTFGKIYALKNNQNLAITYYNKAILNSIEINEDEITSESYLELSKLYEKMNSTALAFEYYKKHISFEKKIQEKEKSNSTEELMIKFDISQYKQNLKVKNQEIELLKYKSNLSKYQYAIFIFLILGLIFFVYRQNKIINMNKRNEKYKEEINTLKEEALNKEVEFKNKQVIEFALQIQEQNNLLSELKQNLASLKATIDDQDGLEKIKKLQLQINDTIEINNEKVELNKQIKDTQDSFLYKLKNLYPELNEKEIQIATYLRLNFNTKQISNQLNIAEQSINNYRATIRKKLNLSKEENLKKFLNNL